jgi:hypothetical protein
MRSATEDVRIDRTMVRVEVNRWAAAKEPIFAESKTWGVRRAPSEAAGEASKGVSIKSLRRSFERSGRHVLSPFWCECVE